MDAVLRYVGELSPTCSWHATVSEAARRLVRRIPGRIERGQYFDFLANNSTRYSLFCKAALDVDSEIDQTVFEQCCVWPIEASPDFSHWTRRGIALLRPTRRAGDIRRGHCRPRPVGGPTARRALQSVIGRRNRRLVAPGVRGRSPRGRATTCGVFGGDLAPPRRPSGCPRDGCRTLVSVGDQPTIRAGPTRQRTEAAAGAFGRKRQRRRMRDAGRRLTCRPRKVPAPFRRARLADGVTMLFDSRPIRIDGWQLTRCPPSSRQ